MASGHKVLVGQPVIASPFIQQRMEEPQTAVSDCGSSVWRWLPASKSTPSETLVVSIETGRDYQTRPESRSGVCECAHFCCFCVGIVATCASICVLFPISCPRLIAELSLITISVSILSYPTSANHAPSSVTYKPPVQQCRTVMPMDKCLYKDCSCISA